MKKSIFLIMSIAFLMIVSFNASVSVANDLKRDRAACEPGSGPCAKTTDKQLVRAINKQLRRHSPIATQMEHITIRSRHHVITITGSVSSKGDKDAISRYVRATHCVKKLKNKLKYACPIGQKYCCEGCYSKCPCK